MHSIAQVLVFLVPGFVLFLEPLRAAEAPFACQAPPLPAPSGAVTRVATEAQLQAAIRALQSGGTILIEPGTYQLSATLELRRGVTDVTVRGANDNCDEVVLVGKGMANQDFGAVPHGIWVGNAKRATVANLTIRDVYYHPVKLEPSEGVEALRLYNVHLIDAGEQFIKSSSDPDGTGAKNCIVEYCTFEYSNRSRSGYTNGVDVHMGVDWIVRRNVFKNLRAPAGEITGPAILFWNRSRGTIVEGNVFLNCQYGIAMGLLGTRLDDHTGGVVRNNFFHRTAVQSGDVGIVLSNSAGTRVLHNTVILSGTYPNAIEYRFEGTTNAEIRNNLCDGAVRLRNNGSAAVSGNVTTAQPSWFVNAALGNLHLTEEAALAIDQADPLEAVPNDIDGDARPQGDSSDVGADEWSPPGVDTVPPEAPTGLEVIKE